MADNKADSPESCLEPSRVIYNDSQCIVVNKKTGEAVEGAAAGMKSLPHMIERRLNEASGEILSLERFSRGKLLREESPPGDRLVLPVAVNRLDVPVTGCALFARTHSALAFLNGAFNGGGTAAAVEKHYWAIIEKPRREISPAGRLVHWLYHDVKHNKSHAYDEPGPGRKKAELAYRVSGEGRNYMFLEIQLFTGRHHQIRSQFEYMGLHIRGDLKYGARRSDPNGGIRLHARALAFPNPSGGERISVQADPPLMDNLWQAMNDCCGHPKLISDS
jgi:23S rRNA pseudouridine1911/1915/1917 synthase